MQISNRDEDGYQAFGGRKKHFLENGLELYSEMAVKVSMSYCQYDGYL